ncbi:unnamed protein product [Pneumocystis jirovecii]|uniref:Succinate dehydrogenase assembly factor 4, mitochondrial n=1 Tax=Pneumocystis jirovecii TaxID=42068 RepID=L0PBR5_PNEJI|nr:unnamed protein product [Pneumocystis jirovecii]
MLDKIKPPLYKDLFENNVHPDTRKPLLPEFEGEVNPNTGEVGGPKTDPLKYGDYSFGGRTTDF